jgi:hypothetical protein
MTKLFASAAIIAALSVAPAIAMAQNNMTNTTAMAAKKPMKAKKAKKTKAAAAGNTMAAAPK